MPSLLLPWLLCTALAAAAGELPGTGWRQLASPFEAQGRSCTVSTLDLALKGAGRAAARALEAHNTVDAMLSELNFTRLKHLGTTEDEAQYGIFQEVPVVLLEGTDLDNSSQELQSNQWCRRRLDGCGHKAVAADLEAQLPQPFKSDAVICVGFGRGVWLMSTYALMYPQNCGYIVWVGSPDEVFDVTFGVWVLAIHPYTDLAASTATVSSDRRKQVPCGSDAACFSSEIVKWTGPDVTDAHRSAMETCVGAKPDAMINPSTNTGMISLTSSVRLPLWLWCLLLRYVFLHLFIKYHV